MLFYKNTRKINFEKNKITMEKIRWHINCSAKVRIWEQEFLLK